MFFRIVVATIVFLVHASAFAAEITALPAKDRDGIILIEGDFKFDDREQFLAKIAPFATGLVILNSNGGNAYAGIEIGKAIRMRGFTTWVPSEKVCASACAFAWLGGTKRLMGKTALVGFHAVSKVQSGERVETGYGNAMYGAYLGQLGLSDQAIFYLSNAAPSSMNWLTPEVGEKYDIGFIVFDPKSDTTPSTAPTARVPVVPPSPSAGLSVVEMDERARNMVIALNVIMSGPDEDYFKILDGLYADQVVYFGKQMNRADIVAQLTKFVGRWPTRSYVVRPDTLRVQCDRSLSACQISGMIDFSAKSTARNQWSRGTATFDYMLAFRPGQKYPVIVNEGGAVVDRQMTALQTITPRYRPDFEPSR